MAEKKKYYKKNSSHKKKNYKKSSTYKKKNYLKKFSSDKSKNVNNDSLEEKKIINEDEVLSKIIDKDNTSNNIGFIKSFVFTLIVFFLIYGVSLLLSIFVLPTVRIYDNSMLPSLNDKNIIMLFKTNNVKRGDVVAVYVDDKMLIKRCVAMENDIVNMDIEGNLYVNDKKIKEEYLSNKTLGSFSIDFPYKVPDNHIFILSDDRLSQSDSRNELIGSIDKKKIYGKALIKVFPIKNIGLIN